ncbi:MAG: Elongation factor Ts [Parcubacteria group bacterium GW2011_GWA2_47_26]|nr:MAG: Elongation factor Ts [Parcubacteria group bacterium GW2011_GWA2_47_26]
MQSKWQRSQRCPRRPCKVVKIMIDSKLVMQLRAQTGAGVLEAKHALEESGGDIEKAVEVLRKSGAIKAAKKSERATNEGLVHAYIHGGGKVGVLLELLCETDFVARNPEFENLAHDLAMQIAAANPLYVKSEDIPQEVVEKEKSIYSEEVAEKPANIVDKIVEGKLEKWYSEVCLMNQPFIKDEDTTIGELIQSKIAKLGENIQVRRFVRYSLQDGGTSVC